MADEQVLTYELWVLDPQRRRQRSWLMPLLLLGLVAALLGVVRLLPKHAQQGIVAGYLVMAVLGIGLPVVQARLNRWASQYIAVSLYPDGLATSQGETVQFGEVTGVEYVPSRDVARLSLSRRAGPALHLRSCYERDDLQELAAQVERRYEAYRLQHLLARPRPRR